MFITADGENEYYTDDLFVMVDDLVLDSTKVQSEADHPNLNDGSENHRGITLGPGEYEGKLMNSSGSYLNAILLENEETRQNNITAALIHPLVITNPDKRAEREASGKYHHGPFTQPYSLACQIPGDDARGLAEFNEMTETIQSLGYVYGDGTAYERGDPTWIEGDSIRVRITRKKAK